MKAEQPKNEAKSKKKVPKNPKKLINVNILDISQTILQDIFTMMMIVDIENCKCDFSELSKQLASKGEELGVDIRIQLEKIFSSMHRI